jgi:hypothetical protein
MLGDSDENWKQPRDSPPFASPWGTWWKERAARGRVRQALGRGCLRIVPKWELREEREGTDEVV